MIRFNVVFWLKCPAGIFLNFIPPDRIPQIPILLFFETKHFIHNCVNIISSKHKIIEVDKEFPVIIIQKVPDAPAAPTKNHRYALLVI